MKPNTTPGQITPPKRQPSKWETEWKRRRFLAVLVLVAILTAVGVLVYGFCETNYKPWHQTIVKVNDKTFDMSYFVKMLHLYGADNNPTQAAQIAQYAILSIQNNELIRQKAEEYNIHVDDITDEEIEAEIHSLFGFDPEGEISEEDFNKQFEEFLDGRNISRSDFEKMAIVPIILQQKLQDAMGDEEYPVESEYDHVRVRAVLLGTEEEAQEVIENWDGDFNQIIKDYSASRFYPDGGYWLVMVYEPEDAEEQEEEGLYIKAILLASEEKAVEVAGEFDGSNFADLATIYSLDSSSEDGGDMGWMTLDDIESKFGDLDTIKGLGLNEVSEPIPENYPDGPVEWLPAGIESSVFDEFAFAEGSETSSVSDPIRDTTYQTQGGYWLVMSYEPEDAETQEEEGLYIKAILLDSKAKADSLKADIESGGDFATLAGENSLDTSTTDGDMGWMTLDDIESKFGAGVLATINGLSQDEMSTPIETTDGYWLVEVTEGDGEGGEGELFINAILLSTKEEAEEVADEFDGSNFADLATTYSLDDSAANGGVIGWMSQEDIESKFGAGVLAIVNNLSQGETSIPIYDEDVSKQSGYWVIEVLDREDRTLTEEHRDSLINDYYSDWFQEELQSGKDEGRIKDYLDEDKLSWAIDHL